MPITRRRLLASGAAVLLPAAPGLGPAAAAATAGAGPALSDGALRQRALGRAEAVGSIVVAAAGALRLVAVGAPDMRPRPVPAPELIAAGLIAPGTPAELSLSAPAAGPGRLALVLPGLALSRVHRVFATLLTAAGPSPAFAFAPFVAIENPEALIAGAGYFLWPEAGRMTPRIDGTGPEARPGDPVGRIAAARRDAPAAAALTPASRPRLGAEEDGRLFLSFSGTQGLMTEPTALASRSLAVGAAVALDPASGSPPGGGVILSTAPVLDARRMAFAMVADPRRAELSLRLDRYGVIGEGRVAGLSAGAPHGIAARCAAMRPTRQAEVFRVDLDGAPAAVALAAPNARDLTALDPGRHSIGGWRGGAHGGMRGRIYALLVTNAALPDADSAALSFAMAAIAGADIGGHGRLPRPAGPPPARAAFVSARLEDGAPDRIEILADLPPGRAWSAGLVLDPARIHVHAPRGWGPLPVAQTLSLSAAGGRARALVRLARPLYADETAALDLAEDWIEDRDGNAGAATMDARGAAAAVDGRSTLRRPRLVDGVSMGRVGFRFSRPLEAGRYQDGIPWAVVGEGATLVEISPPAAAIGPESRLVGGAELNPTRGAQAYDQRETTTWDAARALRLPAALAPWDSVVKQVVNPRPRDALGGTRRHPVWTLQYAGLVALPRAPAQDEIAPPLVAPDGRAARRVARRLDAAAIAAGLPAYSTRGHARPSAAETLGRIGRFNPIVAQIRAVESRRRLTPAGWTHQDGYGLKMAETMNAAGLTLIGDDPDKTALVRWICHHAIQWTEALTAGRGRSLFPAGGQNEGLLLPLASGNVWLGRAEILARLPALVGTNELAQTYILDAATLALYEPHDDPSRPLVAKRKTVTAASGRRASFAGLAYPEWWQNLTGLELVRERDGAAALVLKSRSDKSNVRHVTLAAALRPPLAPGDVVHFRAAYPRRPGDAEWALNGAAAPTGNPAPAANYRTLNRWTGQMLAIKALGHMHPAFAAFEAYVARANAPADPTAEGDFPDHHSTFSRPDGSKLGWDARFWRDHWPAIRRTRAAL